MGKINRTLHYYNILCDARNKEGNIVRCKLNEEKVYNILFKNIIINQEQNRLENNVLTMHKYEKLFPVIDRNDEDAIYFRMVWCRMDALPYVEEQGTIESISKILSDNQNIAEVTHCVYFKKYQTMGIEYNTAGAKIKTITNYFTNIYESDYLFAGSPVLDYEPYKKLHSDKEYSLFDISIKRNSSLYDKVVGNRNVFRACSDDLQDLDTFEIVLKKKKTKKNGFKGFRKPLDDKTIEDILTNNREDIARFSVSQDSISDPIDLLADGFIKKVSVNETKQRSIDSNEMYEEIRKFFILKVSDYCDKSESKK